MSRFGPALVAIALLPAVGPAAPVLPVHLQMRYCYGDPVDHDNLGNNCPGGDIVEARLADDGWIDMCEAGAANLDAGTWSYDAARGIVVADFSPLGADLVWMGKHLGGGALAGLMTDSAGQADPLDHPFGVWDGQVTGAAGFDACCGGAPGC